MLDFDKELPRSLGGAAIMINTMKMLLSLEVLLRSLSTTSPKTISCAGARNTFWFLALSALLVVEFPLAKAEIVTQWRFDDNLDDTAPAGVSADALEAFGDPSYNDGVVGRAVNLTADGLQRLRAEDSDDLDLAESWTLEAFVWPDEDNTGEWDRFWMKWGGGTIEWHWAFRSTGAVEVNNGLDLFINGADNVIKSNDTAEVPLASWSHVALVGDASANTITAWLNGKKVGETEYVEVTPGSSPVHFGNIEDANSLGYSGLIDEAIIHNAAVDAEYLEGRAQLLLGGTNPVARWSFEDNLEDTAPSGVSNDTLEPVGDPEYVPGVPGLGGKAVRITADGLQRLRAEDSDDIDLAESWTLEAFVWPDADNGGEWDRFWIKWGNGGNQWHTAFRSTGAVDVENGLDLFINGGNNIINSNSTAQVPLASWSHVAFVGDAEANTITAWLNGEKVGEADYEAVTPGSGAMNFGNFESPANSLQYSGLIDEALIHAEAVTEAYLLNRGGMIRNRMAPTDIALTSTRLLDSLMVGDSAAKIEVVDSNSQDTHTLELVPGEGDTNNALFRVEGAQLQTAASLEVELGNTLSIRLRATDSTQSTFEKTFELIVGVDDDDDGLLDSWELMFRESLGDLSAAGDFDSDTITDSDEFGLGTDPTKTDTDGDGLDDVTERTAMTNPLESDSDGDGLTDGEEVNGAIKTDPNKKDTDKDGFDDSAELAEGTDPNNGEEKPFRSVVHIGDVDIFDGANDLDLEGDILYAINCFDADFGLQGVSDPIIRGVEFLADHELDIEGYDTTSESGGNLTGYEFTDGESDDNIGLNELMVKTRCCGRPSDIFTFAVTPGDTYKIQVLWGENSANATKRIWDIAFEGAIAVDDVASNGLIIGKEAPRTGAGEGTRWSHTFTATRDSVEVEIGQIEGGLAGEDSRYSVSGFILSRVGTDGPLEITDVARSGTDVAVTWTSAEGDGFSLIQRSPDLIDWTEIVTGIANEAEQTSFVIEDASASEEYYRVARSKAPPILAESFESSANGWVVSDNDGSKWEFGPPTAGPAGAHSGENVFGTDLDAPYANNTNATLRSPVIDLTEAMRIPLLKFWYFLDSTLQADGGQLNYLDENGDLLVPHDDIFWGSTDDWVEFSARIPAALRGQRFILEFRFLSDGDERNGQGWFIDDITLE